MIALRYRLGAAAIGVGIAIVGWAAPAAAHADVVASSPAQGQHVSRSPGSVTIVFDQPVRPDDGGITVLNSEAQHVGPGGSSHPSPNVLRAALPQTLADGAYAADYTATSVDGHVVSGGIVFLVGNVKAGAIAAVPRARTSLTNWVDDFGQFLTYAGILVASGLAFFLAFVFGSGPERLRLRRRTWTAAVVALAGTVVTAAAQAALTGGGWAGTFQWSVDHQVFSGRFGEQTGVQLVGLAACLVSLRLAAPVARQVLSFYGLLFSAGAFVLFGHALGSPERWLSTPADVVHVVFAAMWAGGVVGLMTVLRSRVGMARRLAGVTHASALVDPVSEASGPTDAAGIAVGPTSTSTAVLERTRSLPAVGEGAGRQGTAGPDGGELSIFSSTVGVVDRFSFMAGISFAGIVVAGVLLAVAEVGSLANLFGTGYGQLLLLKVALVGLLLVMAGYNRYLLLPALAAGTARSGSEGIAWGWRRLMGTVRLEAVGMIAVLAVTAVLANGTPSNGAALPAPIPFAQAQPFDGGKVTLRITPNQALVNNWTVQFTSPTGAPADLAESVSIYLTLPSQNVGPIETDLVKTGVGRFVLENSPNPPIVGTWNVVLQVQVSEFSQPDVSFVDKVQ